MDRSLNLLILFFLVMSLLIFAFEFSFADDKITSLRSIKDDNSKSTTLVSSDETFELGFFSPGKSKDRYIGIWYKTTPDVVVWVANRNDPINDTSGEFSIGEKGDLVLLNGAKSLIWSSNLSGSAKDPTAQLLDSGNLVLRERESVSSQTYLWQSFDHPSDTLLAGMKLGLDLRTSFERHLTAWKSFDDPSDGDYTLRMEIKGLPQVISSRGSTTMVRMGPWNGVSLSGLVVQSDNVYQTILVFNGNESYYTYEPKNNLVTTRVTLDKAGQLQRLALQKGSNKWSVMSSLSLPYDPCDNYGYCGANAICSVNKDPICQCMEGFTPTSLEEWEVLNWFRGCVRKTPLDCHKSDGFVKLNGVKLPDLVRFSLNQSMSLEECKHSCLRNCSCTAYTNSNISGRGSGCLIWFDALIDIRELRVKGSTQSVYVKLSASEIKSIGVERKKRRLKIILAASISSSTCIFALLFCLTWQLRQSIKGKSKDEEIDLPLFDLDNIKISTNNFSPENMIGKGGFGPVYKGNLSTGEEVAVKRMSKDSGQGWKEFKNEVDLIAKLQHKNLVTLLGCCIQRDERILIYEYLPNKSLDNFIFDNTRTNSLAWTKTFDIVMGIAKGLLYLHHDSKLQIIHRDLKASNILLDSDLNPKISDFGLARIFGGDGKENRTRTVIGTYGYMSPEYTVDGKFSVKSDVFSFGVLLLEIVSGKRNRRFSHPDHHHNLLGHAWLMWNEGKALGLMDECFKDLCVESQVLKCIHVSLLCVQKYSHDRPTMSCVVLMLTNEGAKLPEPKEPGFFIQRSCKNSTENSSARDAENPSGSIMTATLEAR